ncbi:MAG TPA: SDR family oxidoreductase [Gaiellales bacterium]|jgi:NAD(P)-dependent dehydrogenase (short-subunit alcohol dehydrogenase family)|nr:SDR family oxidoreductase [Gaiellales bacterium]
MAEPRQRTAIVFGARNLGRAVLELLLADGWAVTAVARSRETLDGAAAAGALAVAGDITDAGSVRSCLAEATTAHGPLDLAVNAASAYGGSRSGPFGGGPISEAAVDAFDSWAAAPGRSAFTFLSAAGGWFREHGRPGTLIQVTGGSARRAMPGRGLWAAGSFAVRAITNAAALELREQGIHVALLIVDAGIEPIGGGGRPGVDPAALADPRELARAVRFLAEQDARGTTHELQITPLAERWVP